MVSIVIERLDEDICKRLQLRAAQHGRSMEEEARAILKLALATSGPAKKNLVQSIRRRFAALGGVKLQKPRREPTRRPPKIGMQA